ncbi:MAG: bifunctional non-ous end joining protein LigD [Verrucomicrobiota bacterium]|jgi:hypothetical protein
MPNKPLAQFVAPIIASSVKEPFDDPDWIFETRLDGYRAIAVIDSSGKARLWSRDRLPLGLKFGIAEAVISSDQCFVRCRNRRGFCGLSEIPEDVCSNEVSQFLNFDFRSNSIA